MTKRELIEALEALDCSDYATVMIETIAYYEETYTYGELNHVIFVDVNTIKVTDEL